MQNFEKNLTFFVNFAFFLRKPQGFCADLVGLFVSRNHSDGLDHGMALVVHAGLDDAGERGTSHGARGHAVEQKNRFGGEANTESR